MSWCKSEIKQVGKKALVKNVLCRSHNSRLSPVDQAAIDTFKIIDDASRLQDVRLKMKPRRWAVSEWRANGPLMERWLLKTLITLACNGDQKIGPDSLEAGQPSADLIRIAFGLEKFKGQAGLYLLAAPGLRCSPEDRIEYIPMGHPDCLPGGLFMFKGFPLFIHLGIGGLDPNANIMLPGPSPFGAMANGGINVRPMLRPRKLAFTVHEKLSHTIKFDWS
jgi:hypothetical protein